MLKIIWLIKDWDKCKERLIFINEIWYLFSLFAGICVDCCY